MRCLVPLSIICLLSGICLLWGCGSQVELSGRSLPWTS